jgi:hypothetical protein
VTYLEAINKVLRRLREDEVASPDSTAYSKLIGEFVNDANRLVEDAWDWGELRAIRPLTLFATSSYGTITSLNENFKILGVYNPTDKSELNRGTEKDYYNSVYLEDTPDGTPANYLFKGYTDADNTTAAFNFYPPTDKTRTLLFDIVDRSPELVSGTSDIRTSGLAVVQFAQAMAAEERGETGGTTSSKMYAMAQSTLSDAIAYDAARFPTETVWYDV